MKNLYVIISATPFKLGKLIRFYTHEKYNHTAIALDDDFNEAYTFGRYYKNVTLYAGFVRDSQLRYEHKGNIAEVDICKIPLPDEKYEEVKNYINAVKKNSDEYIYNLFSFFGAIAKKRVFIKNSYTCIEFTITVLEKAGIDISLKKYYSVDQLANILKDYTVYKGIYNVENNYEGDTFNNHVGVKGYTAYTLKYLKKIIKRRINTRKDNSA